MRLSPLQKEYKLIRQKHNALVLFQVKGCYESMKGSAVIISKVLGIPLTKINSVPLAGFPASMFDSYLTRLVKAGYKVAIVEQQTN